MRQIIVAIVFLSALSLCSCNRAGAEDRAPGHEYPSLIRQATFFMFRGLGPTDSEKEAGEAAMALLLRNKEKVAAYIIVQLQDYKTPMAGTDLSAAHYGIVLWKFGPEYVCALEPTVLQSTNEDARVAGTYILGHDTEVSRQARKTIVPLLVNVLKRDRSPRVQAAAIRSLDNIRAVDKSEVVLSYLASEYAKVRRAAVGFYWSYEVPDAFEPLKARLGVEKDPEVCFLLSWTLCKYPDFSPTPLLRHDNPVIRCGALHYLSSSPDALTKENYDAIVARLEKETDVLCKYELADCLFRWRDARCLRLWISLLKGEQDPDRFYAGSVKTAAASSLANLTGLPFHVTDENRKKTRQTGGCIYDGVASKYDTWWNENKKRIRWDATQGKFLYR